MSSKLSLQSVIEIHRITSAEQDCRPTEITQAIAKLAAQQVADDDANLGQWLSDRADEMDRPVDLSDIAASLRSHGVR